VTAAAFRAQLGGVGGFGGARPRVIWLGLATGADDVAALAGQVEAACRAAGLEPDGRPFRPHLTLARAAGRDRAAMPELPSLPDLPAWDVESFALYESRLGHGPAVYSVIEEFPLSR
jgi:2'-5' RNA ligase